MIYFVHGMTRGLWPDREYSIGIARHEHPEEGLYYRRGGVEDGITTVLVNELLLPDRHLPGG